MPEVELIMPGFSGVTDQTRLGLSSVVLIRGQYNTLVDVGHYGRKELLHQALEAHNVAPGDIHRVVLTHAHWDHSQNVDMFPGAEFFIHEAELAYSRAPREGDWATAPYFVHTLTGLKVREISGEVELEPGLQLIETPGHTRGHVSVLVDTLTGTVALSADAVSEAGTLSRGTPGLIFWDEEEARASVKKLVAAAPVIYPGHDRPFRLTGDSSFEYLTERRPIKVLEVERDDGSIDDVALILCMRRTTWVHPQARRR